MRYSRSNLSSFPQACNDHMTNTAIHKIFIHTQACNSTTNEYFHLGQLSIAALGLYYSISSFVGPS